MEEEIKTQDQKDAEAKALGAVVCIDVPKDGKNYIAYLKAPDRYAVGMFLAAMDTSVTQACEYIYDSAVMKEISPDYLEIRNDDTLFISACPAIQRAVPFKKNKSRLL